ncbi:hypothetical protein [Dysosmobacter sp.]|uniref:hypothetical protein n=1 Tax=Dysosmobacter sp. TaxID=2591382 RepID=UPI002A9666B1|nr:hypothetical protein [Dysosmobacter sp.]MDY5611842.1 hypothetical protein [Dysosmobacter sp.]
MGKDMGGFKKAVPERGNEGFSTLITTLECGHRKRAAALKSSRPKGNTKQDNLQFGCPKTVDISGFFKKFCIATRTIMKNRVASMVTRFFFYFQCF